MNFLPRLAARFPRAFPFALVVLACLQVVAASWHVCNYGFTTSCHETQAAGPPKALICFCRDEIRPKLPANTPRLAADERRQFHGVCLAQWLQNLPGQFAATPDFFAFHAPHATFQTARPKVFTSASFWHVRGRAPPLALTPGENQLQAKTA